MKDRLSVTDAAIREASAARDLAQSQAAKAKEDLELKYKKKVHRYKRKVADQQRDLEGMMLRGQALQEEARDGQAKYEQVVQRYE